MRYELRQLSDDGVLLGRIALDSVQIIPADVDLFVTLHPAMTQAQVAYALEQIDAVFGTGRRILVTMGDTLQLTGVAREAA